MAEQQRQQIHEDDTVPRGKAYMSLDQMHVWCHPDDAPAIRENARTVEEAKKEIDQQLAERVADMEAELGDEPTAL